MENIDEYTEGNYHKKNMMSCQQSNWDTIQSTMVTYMTSVQKALVGLKQQVAVEISNL